MKYEYYFCVRPKPELLDYLNAQHIPFQVTTFGTCSGAIFKLYSTKSETEAQIEAVKRITHETPIISVIYTKKELESAEFLSFRPKKQWVSITNDEESCRYTCQVGRYKFYHGEQIAPYRISREPKTDGKTAFWCEDTGWSTVFTDFRIKKLAEDNGLVGLEFQDVLLRGNRVSQNIFQLNSSNMIPRDAICLGYGEIPNACTVCGRKQYFIYDTYQLHLNVGNLPCRSDLYVTERMWGEGIAYPMYVISQRFYRLIRDNNLGGYLHLSPVIDMRNGENH